MRTVSRIENVDSLLFHHADMTQGCVSSRFDICCVTFVNTAAFQLFRATGNKKWTKQSKQVLICFEALVWSRGAPTGEIFGFFEDTAGKEIPNISI